MRGNQDITARAQTGVGVELMTYGLCSNVVTSEVCHPQHHAVQQTQEVVCMQPDAPSLLLGLFGQNGSVDAVSQW